MSQLLRCVSLVGAVLSLDKGVPASTVVMRAAEFERYLVSGSTSRRRDGSP